MANIGDILNSPEQGWRRVLFSDFDSISFRMRTNYTTNYKDFIVQDGVHVYEYYAIFGFSNSPYTTKWRLIGSTIKEEVNLLELSPDFTRQVNHINLDSEHRLLMEGFFGSEDDYSRVKNFAATVEFNTDFVLYAIDFYDGLATDISTPKVVKGTSNEGISGTLANSLLAHLCFNDGSLQDMSGNGNNAIVVGTPTLGVDKDGQAGQSLILNSGNYIYLNKFLQGSTDISGSFIFKVDSGNTLIMAMVDDSDSSKGTFYVMSNGNLCIYYADLKTTDTGVNILDDKYHHLLFISNSTGTNLYLDKKYIGNFIHKMDPNSIYFGQIDIPGRDLNIDEIRFYNRRLTGETSIVNQEPTLEIAEIFDMGANYENNVKYKISEINFNIDFDKTWLGTFIEVKYLDIKADGVSILDKNPIVKYWTNYDKTVRVFDKEVERFGDSTDLYFQIECDGYETSDIIHKELKMIIVNGYSGGYNGGLIGYKNHNSDNYKKSEARILIPLTNTSFISYK